jgi:O-antigen/teichoic acid export membrane protein
LISGLIAGIIVLVGSSFVSSYLQSQANIDPQLIIQTQQFGFVGLVLFLLLGVVSGFILGAVSAFIYNIVVKIVGGIKVGLEKD